MVATAPIGSLRPPFARPYPFSPRFVILWDLMTTRQHRGTTGPPTGHACGTWVSWNRNISHSYSQLVRPKGEEELCEAVRRASGDGRNGRVRAYGNRQSSADIAAGTETLIDTTACRGVIGVDEEAMQITVRCGTTLRQLMREIESRGWSLPCLPDIDTVTIGGALATGTHGTAGDAHPLAEYMVGCRLVEVGGRVREVHDPDPVMPALRCSLGLLGVVSTITLQCRPLSYLRVEEQAVPDKIWRRSYRDWLVQYEFVRIIFLPHTGYAWVVLGDRIEADQEVDEKPAPWYHRYRREVSRLLYKRTARNPRFTRTANRLLRALFFSNRLVAKGTLYGATVTKSRASPLELAEWGVAMDRFDALFDELVTALERRDNDAYAHIPMDVRFLKSDGTWLSTAYGRDTVTVGCVTRHPEHAHLYRAFDLVEDLFLRYGGRPHWAKRFKAGKADLAPLWPRWDEFIELRRRLDPNGVLLNRYLAGIFT